MRGIALLHGGLLIACSLQAMAAIAAEAPNLDLLLFDPVPLSILEDSVPPAATTPATDEPTADTAAPSPPYKSEELLPVPAANPQDIKAVLATISLLGQSRGGDTLTTDIARYEASLKEQELGGNAYSMALPETLMSLAAAYERNGEYPKALTLYERASHIIRVNDGLFTLEQVPVVERMISNYLARGDVISADQQQEYLYYLRRRVLPHHSPEMIQAMQDFARWNVQAFHYYSLQPLLQPAPVTTDSTDTAEAQPSTPPAPTAAAAATVPDLDQFRIQHLFNAQLIYQQISTLLLANFGITDPRLPDNELQLAATNYLFATNVIARGGSAFDGMQQGYESPDLSMRRLGYGEGRESMERRVEYLLKTPGTPPEVLAKARLDLVDWMIATRSRSDIQAVFELAYKEYAESGATPEQIAALFHPPVPPSLPSIVPQRFTRASLELPADAALQYRGFIDVRFTLNKIGDSMSPKLLYSTPNTPDDVTEILLREIRRAQFRPRMLDGKLVDDDRITLRYYYTY